MALRSLNARIFGFVQALLVVLLIGCTSVAPREYTSFTSAGSYEATAQLTSSLFLEDQAAISNAAIEQILDTRVILPSPARLAVVHVGQRPYWRNWSEDFVRLNEKTDRDFLDRLRSSDHIATARYLPSLVTPEKMTLPHLRQAAARLQADLLLLCRTRTDSYERQKFLKASETRAYCTVEAILFDTRTGVVPFSTVVTEQFSATRNRNDYDFSETVARAHQEAIGRAWLRVADEVNAFLAEDK